MNYDNVKVVVGNRVYAPNCIDYTQTPDTYPDLDISVSLSPGNICPCFKVSSQALDLSIKNVIFNPPATIIFWSDKTKTVVKCDTTQETYDPEKGLAMAISKKMMGENKYEYYNIFLHWLKKYGKQVKSMPKESDGWSGSMCDI